jgi:hypothetical protein
LLIISLNKFNRIDLKIREENRNEMSTLCDNFLQSPLRLDILWVHIAVAVVFNSARCCLIFTPVVAAFNVQKS